MSKEVSEVISDSVEYAKENGLEYITPEVILLMICKNKNFREAFEECGGSIKKLKKNIKSFIAENIYSSENINPSLSDDSTYVLALAERTSHYGGKDTIELMQIIHGIFQLEESYAAYYINCQNVEEVDILRCMAELYDIDEDFEQDEYSEDDQEADLDEDGEKESSKGWRQYAPCMNDMLENVNPLIGRDEELERTIQILCRKDKNNPLHIGEPGVGKTAITYGLARMINEDKVPKQLKGGKIFSIDLGGMIAGTKFRGEFESRLKKVLNGISKEKNPIIYIDEIHNLYGAGATGDGSFDASNMLKPYLADGHIRFIGSTTYEEYKKYFEKSKSLVRRFQNVEINEPSITETIEILKGLKSGYEEFHGVSYSDEVIEYAVNSSAKYINERFLPDKAIDLMDEAGAYRKLHPIDGRVQLVDKDVINKVLTSICRVPMETVETDETSGLAELEDKLKGQIFGQDEAITQVTNAVKFSKAGLLEDGKPLASLLFVGPTGVGKTEIARRLAAEMGVKLIRFDMSEYEEKYAVSKLIGASAGYVGYENGGLLTEEIRKNPSAVLLLDEIEKAHDDIYNILLQVMDYATLTDNQGRKADFRNVIIIMTSNIGADKVGKNSIGFLSEKKDNTAMMEEVKKAFKPEFRNRLSRIVIFNDMDEQMADRIVKKKLGELKAMLNRKSIDLLVDESAEKLIKKKGISEQYGAREVERIIRNEIKPLFVDSILFGKLKDGGKILLSVQDEKFCVDTV
jgi:ATP-dependent Clp protease ATP-binding subunit ClpA